MKQRKRLYKKINTTKNWFFEKIKLANLWLDSLRKKEKRLNVFS